MPARPRWLLALPDAIAQLDVLDRPLLTRRDLESLFGVSRARAATLMRAFGAELTGSIRTLPRTALLRQLQTHATFRDEAARRDRVWTALRQARRTGIRVPVPAAALDGRLARLPPGVSVRRDRIEVRFTSATDAVAKLFALAQALTPTTTTASKPSSMGARDRNERGGNARPGGACLGPGAGGAP